MGRFSFMGIEGILVDRETRRVDKKVYADIVSNKQAAFRVNCK